MDRRAFIAAAGAGFALAIPQAGRTSPSAAGTHPLLSTYVTNIADVVRSGDLPVRTGSPVSLKVSPRPYDPLTVLVIAGNDRPVGYLPTNQSRMIASLLQAGVRLQGRVRATRTLPRPSVRLDITIVI